MPTYDDLKAKLLAAALAGKDWLDEGASVGTRLRSLDAQNTGKVHLPTPDEILENEGTQTASGFLGTIKAAAMAKALMGAKPKRLEQGLKGDEGYAYHATNLDRLNEIAAAGKLRTHRPGEFTDQNMWPDAAVEKRAYFGASPEHLWQFAPEEGVPAVLRTKMGPHISRESGTGDLFTRKPIAAKELEYLGDDDVWQVLLNLPK